MSGLVQKMGRGDQMLIAPALFRWQNHPNTVDELWPVGELNEKWHA